MQRKACNGLSVLLAASMLLFVLVSCDDTVSSSKGPSYTVRFFDGGTELPELSIKGSEIDLPVREKSGFTFAGWQIDGDGPGYNGRYRVPRNIEVHARWLPGLWYSLGTAIQLDNARLNYLSEKVFLADDISLAVSPYDSGAGWDPIGTTATPFTGEFDGNGHKVTGLFINSASSNAGLFGVISGAKVQNLGIELASGGITAAGNLGGIVGSASGASVISNSYTKGTVKANGSAAGGIAGTISGGSIINCYSTGGITTVAASAGGIAGQTAGTTVQDCYSTGTVTAGTNNAGGIAGQAGSGSAVSNCYSSGAITATASYAGGIAGDITGSTVTDCHSSGAVTAALSYAGGIAGQAATTAISICYSSGVVKTTTGGYSGGIAGNLNGGSISKSYSTNTVNSGVDNAGGIAGYAIRTGSATTAFISSCYSKGAIRAENDNAGGIAGHVETAATGVSDCYSTGNVYAYRMSGAIAGNVKNATISHCYGRGAITVGNTMAGGIAGQIDGGLIEGCASISEGISTSTASGYVGRIVAYKITSVFSDNLTLNGFDPIGEASYGEPGDGRSLEAFRTQSTYTGISWTFGSTSGGWKMPAGTGFPILYWE